MNKDPQELQIGDCIGDMHYGARDFWINGPYVVQSHARFPASGGCEFIDRQLAAIEGPAGGEVSQHLRRRCTNKCLYVMNREIMSTGYRITAVYSYDNMSFGVIVILTGTDVAP